MSPITTKQSKRRLNLTRTTVKVISSAHANETWDGSNQSTKDGSNQSTKDGSNQTTIQNYQID